MGSNRQVDFTFASPISSLTRLVAVYDHTDTSYAALITRRCPDEGGTGV